MHFPNIAARAVSPSGAVPQGVLRPRKKLLQGAFRRWVDGLLDLAVGSAGRPRNYQIQNRLSVAGRRGARLWQTQCDNRQKNPKTNRKKPKRLIEKDKMMMENTRQRKARHCRACVFGIARRNY
ncbi:MULTISPECIES: hypothetical protein [Rhodopseudomonas]|uniref:hypothetical protein n=1 Tax=Rhodopseudomonas TaxID=1073 RepID=UPI00128D5FED|nr:MULTISPECIES: hypothetical protein [Rhodopseudomonas]MDF3811138.1 hypothetical protein [Rhodopseudomonas sp. BAL398]WOK16790.1 hypothetical protein RBJ75_22030 [Rhodopseudomonas sp. BAL398]